MISVNEQHDDEREEDDEAAEDEESEEVGVAIRCVCRIARNDCMTTMTLTQKANACRHSTSMTSEIKKVSNQSDDEGGTLYEVDEVVVATPVAELCVK